MASSVGSMAHFRHVRNDQGQRLASGRSVHSMDDGDGRNVSFGLHEALDVMPAFGAELTALTVDGAPLLPALALSRSPARPRRVHGHG